MAGEQTATDIRDRFVSEQAYIERYTAFMHSKASVDDSRIVNLSLTLRKHGFPMLPFRSPQETMKSFLPLTHGELLKQVQAIDALEEGVKNALADGRALLQARTYIALPQDDPDGHDTAIDMVMAVEDHVTIREPLTAEVIAKVETRLREMAGLVPGSNDYTEAIWALSRGKSETVIQAAVYLWLNDRVGQLEVILAEFEAIRIIARAVSPEAEINLLRQGFILLMTAFDAAIFDLVRVALWRKFSALVGPLAKDDKVTVSKIAECGDFDALRDHLIEAQLKKRSIKDLLGLLKGWNLECVDPATGEKHERLIELVLRRNLHVHNRGVVDAWYVSDKNLNGLQLGEVAVIDEAYWNMANRLCKDCVERVAAWADR